MAYTRQQDQNSIVLGDSLDSFVSGVSQMYAEQSAARNADDELNFNKQVLEGNISLADQLTYRKEQLKRVSDDPTEKRRISGEISTLTDRIEADNFTKGYTDQVTKFSSGAESIDSVISWLTDYRSSTTDPNIQSKIDSELETQQQKKFDLNKQMLMDQTNYALNDKTAGIINTQISNVQSAKSKALLAGDEDTAASLDLQLQALQKALADNSISKDIKDMAVATATGFSHATDLLDSYNSKIQSSGTSTPVTVNGVTYGSSQEYWTYARDSYLADQSQNGFFPRIDSELTTAIKVKNSNNTLTSNDISTAASTYNNLYGRPELANFSAKLDAAKADTLQTAANFISDKITNSYDNSNDLTAAMSALSSLKGLGVNVDAAYQKIVSSATSIQNASVSEIVKQAQNLMQLSPGLSVGDAITQAISQGYGKNLSPNAVLGRSPGDTAASILNTNQNQNGQPDLSNTMGGPPGAPGQPQPGVVGTGSGTYQIKSGDTLSKIAAANGTTVAALAQLNGIADPNKIQAGATLKLPGTTTVATTSQPATGSPAGLGPEIFGTPTVAFQTVNGKNYALAQNSPAQQATPQGTPSAGVPSSGDMDPTHASAPIGGSSVTYYRGLISNGQMTPLDAYHAALAAGVGGAREGGTTSEQQAAASLKSSLWSGLGTINLPQGQKGTVNPDGSVLRTTTAVYSSNTSVGTGQTNTSVSAQQPQQQQPQSQPSYTPPSNPAPVAPTVPQAAAPATTPASTTPKPVYQGSSIVDYLSLNGKDSSFAGRTTLAKQYGIQNYSGTADQNTQLLKTLRGF